MTREELVKKWRGTNFEHTQNEKAFLSDLDELLKDNAVGFAKFNIEEKYISEQRESEWDEWYDTYIKQLWAQNTISVQTMKDTAIH